MLALALLPDWDCNTCTAAHKLHRGCEEDAEGRLPVLDGEQLTRCPRRPLMKAATAIEYQEAFWLYEQYQRGHLPEGSGVGIYGQSHVAMEMIRVIDTALSDVRAEKDKKAKAVAAAKKRAGVV